MTNPDENFDLTAKPDEIEAHPGLSKFKEKPYSQSDDREKKRGIIALSLVGILCVSVLLSFFFIMRGTKDDIETIKSVLTIIFAPIVGLVGAVTGFYFGEKQSAK